MLRGKKIEGWAVDSPDKEEKLLRRGGNKKHLRGGGRTKEERA